MSVDIRRIIGSRIREERQKRDWTLKELSTLTKLNTQTLALLERGEFDLKISQLQRLAAVLDIPAVSLLEGTKESRKIAADVIDQRSEDMISTEDFAKQIGRDIREVLRVIARRRIRHFPHKTGHPHLSRADTEAYIDNGLFDIDYPPVKDKWFDSGHYQAVSEKFEQKLREMLSSQITGAKRKWAIAKREIPLVLSQEIRNLASTKVKVAGGGRDHVHRKLIEVWIMHNLRDAAWREANGSLEELYSSAAEYDRILAAAQTDVMNMEIRIRHKIGDRYLQFVFPMRRLFTIDMMKEALRESF
jgi:transcriptional regulator with XRE-family HTH domain